MCEGHNLGSWRCRLNLSMFLLTISVGGFWSVQSVLEFNAIKENLRIMSDIERVFWTVLFCMASRVFVFLTLSDSSLLRNWFVCREPRTPVVKLVWEAFLPLCSWLLRWWMKPRWELLLFLLLCPIFVSVQYSSVFQGYTFFSPCQRLGHPACRKWRCLCLFRRSRWRKLRGILRCLFGVWPYSVPLLVEGSHVVPYIPKS